MFFVYAALIYVLWNAGYSYYRYCLLVRRVKKGQPLHHAPGEKRSRHLAGKVTRYSLLGILWITCIASDGLEKDWMEVLDKVAEKWKK